MNEKKYLEIDLEGKSVNLRTYLKFLNSVENLSDGPAAYQDLIHTESEFREIPNLLNKNGQVRNLEASLEGLKKAKMILSGQHYEITSYTEAGEKLVIEKIWTGQISMDVANLKKGQELKAHICAAVEFNDGMIFRHRIYDC